MSPVLIGRRAARAAAAGGLLVAVAVGSWIWWRGTPPPPPPLISLLPRGSAVSSQGRVELDGRPPLEIAATVFIPRFPGVEADLGHALIAGYDRLRHRWRILFLAPLAGIPFALEGGPLLGSREAAVFTAFAPDGVVRYRVVTLRWGRPVVVYEGQMEGGTVEVSRGLIVERRPNAPRAFRWDGRGFRPAPVPPPIPPAVVWRYWTDRFGYPRAETSAVFLVPGQRLLPVRSGGGPAVIPIPDASLDTIGGAFRARRPGTYRLTVPDFAGRPGGNFRLSIEVVDEQP